MTNKTCSIADNCGNRFLRIILNRHADWGTAKRMAQSAKGNEYRDNRPRTTGLRKVRAKSKETTHYGG